MFRLTIYSTKSGCHHDYNKSYTYELQQNKCHRDFTNSCKSKQAHYTTCSLNMYKLIHLHHWNHGLMKATRFKPFLKPLFETFQTR